MDLNNAEDVAGEVGHGPTSQEEDHVLLARLRQFFREGVIILDADAVANVFGMPVADAVQLLKKLHVSVSAEYRSRVMSHVLLTLDDMALLSSRPGDFTFSRRRAAAERKRTLEELRIFKDFIEKEAPQENGPSFSTALFYNGLKRELRAYGMPEEDIGRIVNKLFEPLMSALAEKERPLS